MLSNNWDVNILRHNDDFKLLRARLHGWETNWTALFPIVPKKWPDVQGHFSMSPQIDLYMSYMGRDLDLLIDEYDIEITMIPPNGQQHTEIPFIYEPVLLAKEPTSYVGNANNRKIIDTNFISAKQKIKQYLTEKKINFFDGN